MKKISFIFSLVFLFAMVSMSFGQLITATSHDLSSNFASDSGAEICIACHVPHNASTTVTTAPLWQPNQNESGATFDMYTSGTMNTGTIGQPSGISKLCLGCHDGTTLVWHQPTAAAMTGTNMLGTDLSNDHPISFTYDDALATADGGLHAPTTTDSGLGGKITGDMLSAGKLECSSCHDPHSNEFGSFLRKSNAASALCLTCHDK